MAFGCDVLLNLSLQAWYIVYGGLHGTGQPEYTCSNCSLAGVISNAIEPIVSGAAAGQ